MTDKTAKERWYEMISICNEKVEYIDTIFVSPAFINQLADELGYDYVVRYEEGTDTYSWLVVKKNRAWVRTFDTVPSGICCRVQLKDKKPDHTYLYLPEDLEKVIETYPNLEETIRANNA